MSALTMPWEMDTHTRRRRGSSAPPSHSLVNACIGRKITFLEALLEQPDCEEPSADRWPGHEPVTFSTEYQLSPTQPMTLRKAASIVSGQTVQVKSPPPNVSGGTASLMNRAKQSLRTILGQIQTSTLLHKGCTKLACQAFFSIKPFSPALARCIADKPQKSQKRAACWMVPAGTNTLSSNTSSPASTSKLN